MDLEKIKELLQATIEIKPNEIGCDDCEQNLDEYVTHIHENEKITDESMILVKEHLESCKFCHEEFETLLEALKKMEK